MVFSLLISSEAWGCQNKVPCRPESRFKQMGGYHFPKIALTNYHKLDDLKQVSSPSQFWRLEDWNQGVSRTMLPPSEDSREESFLDSSGNPWLVAVSLHSLPPSLHSLFLCMCPLLFL